jgi:hypothetical protein
MESGIKPKCGRPCALSFEDIEIWRGKRDSDGDDKYVPGAIYYEKDYYYSYILMGVMVFMVMLITHLVVKALPSNHHQPIL